MDNFNNIRAQIGQKKTYEVMQRSGTNVPTIANKQATSFG